MKEALKYLWGENYKRFIHGCMMKGQDMREAEKTWQKYVSETPTLQKINKAIENKDEKLLRINGWTCIGEMWAKDGTTASKDFVIKILKSHEGEDEKELKRHKEFWGRVKKDIENNKSHD